MVQMKFVTQLPLGLKSSQNLCSPQTFIEIEPGLCIPQLLHLIHLLGPRAVQLQERESTLDTNVLQRRLGHKVVQEPL